MYFYMLCFLCTIIWRINTVSSNCEKNSLPDSFEVTNSDDIILKCSKPKASVIQKNRFHFFNNESSWHFYALNFKLCASNFTSYKCNGSNGEWISGINSLESKNINVSCCYNDDLKSSKFLKYFYIEKRQKLKVGEITKNGTAFGFAYISNIMKIINYDKSVTYKIAVNKISYHKTKLQMHGITTAATTKILGDSKATTNSSKNDNDEENDLTSIEFGICDNYKNSSSKNASEKPCSEKLSPKQQLKFNSHHLSSVLTQMRPFSRKLYQAPLRPGTSRQLIVPSKTNVPLTRNSADDDDFSIEFAGSDKCPFEDGDDTADFNEGNEANELTADATNVEGNINGNGNSNANSNINSNSQINSNNQNSQTSSNQNSQITSNDNSNSNLNSQTNSNQNTQTNQNSQTTSNQNFQTNSNININSNSNLNSQTNTLQNSFLQSQNNLPQDVQSQNPVNPAAMSRPNVPFVQNPINPLPASDYGYNGYYPAYTGANGGSWACFSADTEVQMINGKIKRMDELAVDDWIYSAGVEKFGFSRVISWLHRKPKLKFEFIKITLENGKNLKITAKHYIYKSDCFANETMCSTIEKQYIEAEKLQISDCLLHLNNKNQLLPTKIIKIESIFEEGIYAPLTDSGNIFVNGILASCYSEIDSHSLSSSLPRLKKYFKIAIDLFKIIFLAEPDSQVKHHQNEIELIPGIEMLIETVKSNLYPNYQK